MARKLGAVHPVLVQMSKTLMSEADGADLLFTGLVFEDGAANVAEYYGIPLATLHYFPMRPNGQLLPNLPAPLGRTVMKRVLVAGFGPTRQLRESTAPRTRPSEGRRPRVAAGHRTRSSRNPGLRRGVLSGAGSGMGEMG